MVPLELYPTTPPIKMLSLSSPLLLPLTSTVLWQFVTMPPLFCPTTPPIWKPMPMTLTLTVPETVRFFTVPSGPTYPNRP